MDYQTIIQTFFGMLGRFDFDQAKNFIDRRREILQKLAPTFPNQAQLMTMLTTFNHLAEVEKNYHNQPFSQASSNHSFLPATSFLRKTKSLKSMYQDILVELQQLEQIEKQRTTSQQIKNDQSNISIQSQETQNGYVVVGNIPDQKDSSTKTARDEKDSPVANQVPQSPSSAFRNNFFRVLSPVASSNSISSMRTNQSMTASSSQTNLTPNTQTEPLLLSSSSGYEPPPNSTTTTPVVPNPAVVMREFSEELISHFCKQLQNFIQARQDMIDIYGKLTEASSQKYTSVDGIAFRLSMLCRQYHKYFHHPLLEPIKEGMTLECESLMTLIKATIDIQHWRFLASLCDLQDAQSKLNYWAACTFNKESTRRRFKVSKTPAPRLYEWLCRFKDFLIAKFSLYFHSVLSRNFPPANFRLACSRLSVDHHAKLVSFQRKTDALFVALLYDVSNEKDFRGFGYNFPSRDYQLPQGKSTLQPMLVIPQEGKAKLSGLQAEVYMIVVTNTDILIKDGHYKFHDNIKKLTYHLTKPDVNVVFMVVCEGQRTDRDSTIRTFSIEFANQFAHLNSIAN